MADRQNVVGNEGISADLSGGYDFRVPRFDYFSMGPCGALPFVSSQREFLELESRRVLQRHYSPQSSVITGVALQWLSEEGHIWQWQ